MKRMVYVLFLLTFIKGLAFAKNNYPLDLKPDHAKLSEGHIDSAEKYMNSMLKIDGRYEFLKVQQFLERLKKEKQSIIEDSYETTLIENLDLKWQDFDEAKADAEKELNEKKNDFAQGYNKFLIPQIELLLLKIKENAPENECDSIVDAFNIVYSAYYTPDAKRNMWNYDRKIYTNMSEGLLGYKFYKDDAKTEIQANNLAITKEGLETISECLAQNNLGADIRPDTALTHEEVLILHDCTFDISKLDPIKSPFWNDVKDEPSKLEAKDLNLDLFPRQGEKIYFSEMRYSSVGSKKLNGYIRRGDKKIKFKIKMGHEVFPEVAVTYLAQMVGFHQDHVIYGGNIKLYFDKDKTFAKFKRSWRRRYNQFENYVGEKGIEGGEEYVILRNVLLESKQNEKVRIEAYHPDGWDLPNRREQRGALAFYSWLNISDLKPGNYMVNLVKGSDGTYFPELSLQDLGYSLRSNLSFNPKYIYNYFKYSNSARTANTFETKFLSYDENYVKFFWNDIGFFSERFNTTTYNDLRWMVRKIARLTMKDIRYAMSVSGMPKDEQDLFAIKIAMRRNSLVEAFDLQTEYPLIDLPDLKSYSPNANIKDGKIVVSQLEDSAQFEQPKATIWTTLTEFLSHVFDLPALGQKLTMQVGGGGLSLNGDANTTLWDGKQGKTISFGAVNAGIKLNISRRVEFNPEPVTENGSSSLFAVIDTLRIEFSANAGGFSLIKNFIPVGFGANLQAYTKEFQMIQYSDSWQKGYLRPFKLVSVLLNYKKFVIQKLQPQELIKIEDGYGFGMGFGMGLPTTIPTVNPGVGAFLSWRKTSPEYYFRDSFGQLYVYYAKDQFFDSGINVELAKLNTLFVNIPIIAYYSGQTYYRHNGELFSFDLPTSSRMRGAPVLTQMHRIRDQEAFEQLMQYGPYDPRVLIHRVADIVTHGKWQRRYNVFLAVFKSDYARGRTKTVVKLKNNQTRTFYRAFYHDSSNFGLNINVNAIINGYLDSLLLIENDLCIISSEIDEQNIRNSTVGAIIYQYDRKLNREALNKKLAHLNKKYSQNNQQLFFRNYILPDTSQVDVYRKVNSQMRIYVSGRAILDDFTKLSKAQIKAKLMPFFDKEKLLYSPNLRRDKLLRMQQIKKSLGRAVSNIWGHRQKIISSSSKTLKLAEEFVDLIKDLHPERNGTEILKGLFGEKNIFVYGEVFGIYPSFSQLQTFEAVVGRRFAGKSWGGFNPTPPIRKFLAENDIMPMNIYPFLTINEEMIFTNLPYTQSFNW